MKIAIVGAGWYGCHLALVLTKLGHHVTVFEKNSDIFQQISGKFGIRLHAGPHYPRSIATRASCHRGFDEFKLRYPELIIEHDYSIYGLGEKDADNQPAKVSLNEFNAVCSESASNQFINAKEWGYNHLLSCANLNEPSIVVGERLRATFKKYLHEARINILFNSEINYVQQLNPGCFLLGNDDFREEFDAVINASSYQSLLPKQRTFPLGMEVVYQPCIALRYQDKKPDKKPLSFIVMDGWFPCLMPYIEHPDSLDTPNNGYILTHGKWTIMGSFDEPSKAQKILGSLSDDFIESKIKPLCEHEMNKFWPTFSERFQFIGWKGSVLAKLKTTSEFRSAVTFSDQGVIHIIPGKVSNIFDAEREVLALLNKENIITQDNYHYMKDGVLDASFREILDKPTLVDRNTCTLQTFDVLHHQRTPLQAQSFFGVNRLGDYEQKMNTDHEPLRARL